MDIDIMIPILIVAAFAGTAIIVFAMRKSQAKQADIRAMAEENGWRHDITTDASGHTRITHITSRRASWIVEERFTSSNRGEGGGMARRLTWTDPTVSIPSGLAVMSLAMPEDKAAKLEKFLDTMGDGMMGQHMVQTFFGAVADRATELDAVTAPGARGAMLATPDAREALLPIASHPALSDTRIAMPKGAMPTIIRSPEGLQLYLKTTIGSPDQLLAMIELGETLAAALPRSNEPT
ncbi:hypothetical protein HKCCE4037_01710 [Rhodobacterales bacterium HKCCE4037]|nr:hypothetical protein [Rhodobacterales bacterium HKCCE4037]